VRIIYDTTIPAVEPVKASKEMPTAAVTGSGSPSDEAVEWDVSAWQKTELPNYEVRLSVEEMMIAGIVALFGGTFDFQVLTPGALSCGLEVLLDSLLYAVGASDPTASPTVLDSDAFANLSWLSSFYPDVSLEDALWRPYDGLKPDSPDVKFDIGHVALTFAKYKLDYFLTDDYQRDRVEITVLEMTESSYRGVRLPQGQGAVDFRFDLRFFADKITIRNSPAPDIIDIDSIDVALGYGRTFTPALLVSDPRVIDPLTIGKTEGYGGDRYPEPKEQVHTVSAALAAKPIGNSALKIESVNVATSVNWSPGSIATAAVIAAALALIGLYLVESLILGLIAGIDVGAAIPPPYGPIIVAGLIVTLTIVILLVAPIALRGEIERRIGAELSKDTYRLELDKSGLLAYAGEGLAEALARKAITTINSGGNPLPWGLDRTGQPGQNRFQEQFWQWVFVSGDRVHVRYRR
jgi:hypothetical protein